MAPSFATSSSFGEVILSSAPRALFQHLLSRGELLWGLAGLMALAVPHLPWVLLQPVLAHLGPLVGSFCFILGSSSWSLRESLGLG